MSIHRFRIGGALFGLILSVAACGGSTVSDGSDSATQDASSQERPSKEELLVGFNESLTQAQQSQGPGSPAMAPAQGDKTPFKCTKQGISAEWIVNTSERTESVAQRTHLR